MKRTDAIIIMDGFGISPSAYGNAIIKAGAENIGRFIREYPSTHIAASGRAVGLPEGQMGNSEVGHLNIGAGRTVYQDITMIDKSIEDGDFFKNEAFLGAIGNVKKTGGALHLMGLLSDGGVHSMNTHLYALLELAKCEGVKKVYVHCFTDGRDVPPASGLSYIEALSGELGRIGVGEIGTVIGRYYIMDRDNRWDRVKVGYDALFGGAGVRTDDIAAAVKASYQNEVYDEFLQPILSNQYPGVNNGDSIIFFNFRSDRAREITRAAIYPDFTAFERSGGYKKTFYVGMTQYDASFAGIHTAFPPKDIQNTLGEYLSKAGKTQARIAETEKYAHVTFFFNGGVEQPNENEKRILIASPKVATYDLKPEMSAYEVTDAAIKAIDEGLDVLILNYANCDMVGHTGMLDAATAAVGAVDECVQKLVTKILSTGGTALLTADHGNAEVMMFEDGAPCTSHTTNLVPFALIGERYKGAKLLQSGGALCDIAPTLLEVMGLPKPAEMTGQSLLK